MDKRYYFIFLLIFCTACTSESKWNKMAERAETLSKSGDYDASLKAWKELLDFSQKKFPGEEEAVISAMSGMADVYRLKGEFEKAGALLEKVLPLQEKSAGKESLDVALTLNNLGVIYGRLKKWEAAKQALEKSMPIIEKEFGEAALPGLLYNLAELHENQGQFQEAESLMKKMLETDLKLQKEESSEEKNIEIAIDRLSLARIYVLQKKTKEAYPLYQEALRNAPHNSDVADSVTKLAQAFQTQGLKEEADRLLKKAAELSKYAQNYFCNFNFFSSSIRVFRNWVSVLS